MGSATVSDGIVGAALWIGVGSVLISVGLLVAVIALRIRLTVLVRRRTKLSSAWRKAIAARLAGDTVMLLPIATRDTLDFLCYWNGLHEWLRGESAARLNDAAREIDIAVRARAMLRRRRLRDRVAAAAALGNFRDPDSCAELEQLILDGNPLLSLTAARALIKIDPGATIPRIIPLISRRADWPPVRIAGLLHEAGAAQVSKPLAAAIRSASPESAAVLLRYADMLLPEDAWPLVRDALNNPPDERVLTATLRVVRDPRALPQIRALTHHARWHIRMIAAVALGRLGTREDCVRLIEMLGDSQWWVRYRAARALARFPGIGPDRLKEIQTGHVDRYARDILAHVIAETASA